MIRMSLYRIGTNLTKCTTIQMEGLQHNIWKQASSSATSSQSLQSHLRVDHDVSTRVNRGSKAEREGQSGSAGLFPGQIRTSRAQFQKHSWHVLAFCFVLDLACAILVAIPACTVTYTVIHAHARAHALSLSLTRVHVPHTHDLVHSHIYMHGDCDPCHSCSLLFITTDQPQHNPHIHAHKCSENRSTQ